MQDIYPDNYWKYDLIQYQANTKDIILLLKIAEYINDINRIAILWAQITITIYNSPKGCYRNQRHKATKHPSLYANKLGLFFLLHTTINPIIQLTNMMEPTAINPIWNPSSRSSREISSFLNMSAVSSSRTAV